MNKKKLKVAKYNHAYMATALNLILTLYKAISLYDNKLAKSVSIYFEVAFKMYPVFYTNNFMKLQLK